MMTQAGHEVTHFGHADSDIEDYAGCEHITVTDDDILRQCYGTEYVDQQAWIQRGFGSYFKVEDLAHCHFHAEFTKEYLPVKQPHDIVVSFWGWGHKAIHDALPADVIFVEGGIGYPSAFARWRIYESHAIMSAMYGAKSLGTCDMDNYHRVINNYFDPNDFDYSADKDDYVLFLGRVYSGKGVDIAIDATERAGRRLLIAGQGTLADMGYTTVPAHVTEIGYADVETRRRLLSRASALFIASKYLEPFAGVQVEAWLSGTPVISPDYAAFAELNQHGVTGFRCSTMRDYVHAIKNIDQINPMTCRQHGVKFTMDAIAPQYTRYFQDLLDVYQGAGWYTMD
jgi:glycosyltransferase involved in cell wall biosynthesis